MATAAPGGGIETLGPATGPPYRMDATATCPVAQPGTGTIRTSGLRGLAQVNQARLGGQMVEGHAERADNEAVLRVPAFDERIEVLRGEGVGRAAGGSGGHRQDRPAGKRGVP